MSNISRETFDQVMVPNYSPMQMIPEKGEGSKLWDTEGKEYIDMAGGIAVNALGHCHPAMVSALNEQAQKLWHMSNVFTNKPALELAQKLIDSTFAEKVFFANSGGEANEAAFKLARKYAKDNFGEEKNEIIAFYQGFHGRTLFTVSVGGQEKYTKGFEPLPGGIKHVEYNNLEALKEVISDKTCAVVMEPLQGEGGIIVPDNEFVQGVRDLCDKHNALLVFDEVQTGMGRTGKLYAYMHTSVTPDILSSAKALGGGFPIGAMLTTDKVAKSFVVGTHGSTYGGNPLGCAVASKVFDVINTPEVLDGVVERHEKFKARLNQINDKYNCFSEIRGRGLLIGAALNESFQGRARDFMNATLAEGALILMAGPNVLRMAPSLLITDDEMEQGLAALERGVAQVVA
ncbi:aspartate aminotransferase family protein [Pleionea sediminis]|uniref:aspartate aminotransferase family protein n=1 Tax=Pleionea sediminis TaxID=2569479 RepID=UPI0011859496|nr:aspartate aminotransferase family protein [Pleionea sediminis]